MTAEESVAALLAALGWQDAELEGTPARVAEFLGSYVQGPLPAMSTFPHPGDDPVVFRDLPYHSLCACTTCCPFLGTSPWPMCHLGALRACRVWRLW